MKKLRLAIAGFTACSGCQLTLLNCEAELLQIVEHFDFDYFPLACSPAVLSGSYDAALVEGCISSAAEADFLLKLRKHSAILIAIGTCAAYGGIPAMPMLPQSKNFPSNSEPRTLGSIVQVDGTLHGCPPEKYELINLLSDLLRGVLPQVHDFPVCTECKIKENSCLLTEHRQLCLGGLTLGGCNAHCPSLSVPCEGCRGPVPGENFPAALAVFASRGIDPKTVIERLCRFSPRQLP